MSRDRSRSPLYKSRSPSPREWKKQERRRVSDRDRDFDRDKNAKVRLFVSNIPYDMRWQDLKDLFREKVGSEVSYVELYDGPDGKSSGSGVVEVKGHEVASKAIEILHRYEIKGRFMVVREEREKDRMRFQRPSDNIRDVDRGGATAAAASRVQDLVGGALGVMNMASSLVGGAMNMGGSVNLGGGGLNMQLLNQLGIDPSSITNQVFVANLDYKSTKAKIEEIFRIAGNVIEIDLKTDKDGRSRGMCTVRYEHPMEAVQAIALFNQQTLYDRQLAVRMDKWVDPILQEIPTRMPSGLKSLGIGFGAGGLPLLNIAQISNTLTLSAITGQLSLQMGNVGSLGAGLMLGGGGAGVSANPSVLGSAAPGSMSGLSGNVFDSLRNNGMYSSGRSESLDRGGVIGSMMDERGGGMESRMSGGGNVYSSSSGGGGGRLMFDRAMDYDHGRAAGMDYDRGDRSDSDAYGRSDTSTVFVKNLPFAYSWQSLMDRFKDCGDVRTAMIKMSDGRSRGMGTVSFYNPEDARRAVHMMNGVRIEGRPIDVRLDWL